MYGEPSKQIIDRRRELVRHLHYSGLSIPLILERLEKHDTLFTLTSSYDDRYQQIHHDIEVIKKEAMDVINIDAFDAKEQHALYIDRQKYLYHLALQDGNIALASTISKDIAKSYGVQTDEPIIVAADIMTLMKKAQQDATKKLEEKKAIDITPPVAKPSPESIFAKH